MRSRKPSTLFDGIWAGLVVVYLSGLSWNYTHGIGLLWGFLIAVALFIIGEGIVRNFSS